MAKDIHYSSNSAPPEDERLRKEMRNAGIPLEGMGRTPQVFPAQEQAAARSRNRMVSYQGGTAAEGDPAAAVRNAAEARTRTGRVESIAQRMRQDPSHTDPDGSWTGVPENPWETPVQDADDL